MGDLAPALTHVVLGSYFGLYKSDLISQSLGGRKDQNVEIGSHRERWSSPEEVLISLSLSGAKLLPQYLVRLVSYLPAK